MACRKGPAAQLDGVEDPHRCRACQGGSIRLRVPARRRQEVDRDRRDLQVQGDVLTGEEADRSLRCFLLRRTFHDRPGSARPRRGPHNGPGERAFREEHSVELLELPIERCIGLCHAARGCQDDQDYGRGDAWSGDYAKWTVSAWDQLSGNLDQRYFAVRYGDAHLFFTDSCRFSGKRDGGADDSMFGAKQKAWLKKAMSSSSAPVLVLFMPRQLSHVKNNFKNEYDELVSFFKKRVQDGHAVLICSGNSHLQYMGQHPSAYTQEEAFEFCSSGTDRAGQRSRPTKTIKNREDGINAFGLVEIDTANKSLKLRSIGSDTGNVILSKDHPI